MTDRNSYISWQSSLLRSVCNCIFCLSCFFFLPVSADDKGPFDEISISVSVSGLGGRELEALIQGEQAYLSVSDLFDFLKINHQPSDVNGVVSGFYLSEGNRYSIDAIQRRIIIGDKVLPLNRDEIIQTPAGIYLRSGVFGKVFGLNCVFNFRSLSVNLTTTLELPVISEKRREMLRDNLRKLKSEIKADSTILRRFSAFNPGTLDWNISSTIRDRNPAESQLNLRVGALLAGGEGTVGLNFDSRQNFNIRQQTYLWRYVNNEPGTLRQIKVGKLPVQSTASLYSPVLGVQFTNTPTTLRRSFGTFVLSDVTEPGWTVELYINQVLIDYTKADPSGFFTFQVPIIYGNTMVTFRFFGPWGEERFKEQRISVPYNFLPKNELEYVLSLGVLEDGQKTRYSRADLKYGLGNRITVGTGFEYLSALDSNGVMPFVNASLRLGSSFMLSGDYTYGVRGKAVLNYRLPTDLMLEVSYTRYERGQMAVSHNFLEERKIMLSKPYHISSISGYSRLTVRQIVYSQIKQTTANLLLSASTKGINASLTTYAQMISPEDLNIYSNLAMSLRLPYRFVFKPELEYNYNFGRINEVKGEVERQIARGSFFSLAYHHNFNFASRSIAASFRFDLSFARGSIAARQTNGRTILSQSISGGATGDVKSRMLNLNNHRNVGVGGVVIYPFLDLNSNQRRDSDEPKVPGLNVTIKGARIQQNAGDTSIRVTDLEPYRRHLIELSSTGFDNIAWQLAKKNIALTIEPNKMQLIEVPVSIAGEVTGTISGVAAKQKVPGRVTLNIYRKGTWVAKTVSESDGYFSFLGLAPGSYTAMVDSEQLSRLQLTASPASIKFEIEKSVEGDVVGNIDFKLYQSSERVTDRVMPAVLITAPSQNTSRPYSWDVSKAVKDVNITGLHTALPARETHLSSPGGSGTSGSGDPESVEREKGASFRVRITAIGDKAAAMNLKDNLLRQYGHPVTIYFEGTSTYYLYLSGFQSRSEAEAFLPVLSSHNLNTTRIVAPMRRK